MMYCCKQVVTYLHEQRNLKLLTVKRLRSMIERLLCDYLYAKKSGELKAPVSEGVPSAEEEEEDELEEADGARIEAVVESEASQDEHDKAMDMDWRYSMTFAITKAALEEHRPWFIAYVKGKKIDTHGLGILLRLCGLEALTTRAAAFYNLVQMDSALQAEVRFACPTCTPACLACQLYHAMPAYLISDVR
jgi:hypothetical protein